jgi:hypothetical protein
VVLRLRRANDEPHVQGAPSTETCVRVRGICHSAATATGNLIRVPERGPGICDLSRHVLGTVERRLLNL